MVPVRITVSQGSGDPAPTGDVRHPSHVQFGERLTSVPIPDGLPADPGEVLRELHEYWNVLLGREEPPIDSPYLGLMEYSVAVYSRAQELDALIHEGESTGAIKKSDAYYKVRVGALRSFIEAAKKHCDLGSRRLTQEEIISRQRYDARI
jgi:hypothetical protein